MIVIFTTKVRGEISLVSFRVPAAQLTNVSTTRTLENNQLEEVVTCCITGCTKLRNTVLGTQGRDQENIMM